MKKQSVSKEVYHSLALISQFGITMLVPIFLCLFLGMFIDSKLETSYWVIIFFFMGSLAGFNNIYRLAKKIFRKWEDENHERKN